jgi:predicted  nucleic acid-binding Zn-ribbon protein
LQTIDLRIQEMEREKRQIPQSITSLEEELKKEEDRFRAGKAELEKLQKDWLSEKMELNFSLKLLSLPGK